MRAIRVSIVFACVLLLELVSADAIRVGAKHYRDVYIKQSKQYYVVHHPEEGRIEKVSRRRQDVSGLRIEVDELKRQELFARFEARKAEVELASQKSGRGSSKTRDSGQFQKRQQLEEQAKFETQLAHWKGLSDAERNRIVGALEGRATRSAAHRSRTFHEGKGKIEGLETVRSMAREQQEAAKVVAGDAIKVITERSAAEGYGEMKRQYALRRDNKNPRTVTRRERFVDDFTVDYYQAAESAQRNVDRRRVAAVEEAYSAANSAYERELDRVNGAISWEEKNARSVQSKLHDSQLRYRQYRTRIEDLDLAIEQNYVSRIGFRSVANWDGNKKLRTEPFGIGDRPWRLHCRPVNVEGVTGFSVAVYSADTELPITSIGDGDFLGMRARILDGPGPFYLVIDPGSTGTSYKIDVSAVTE